MRRPERGRTTPRKSWICHSEKYADPLCEIWLYFPTAYYFIAAPIPLSPDKYIPTDACPSRLFSKTKEARTRHPSQAFSDVSDKKDEREEGRRRSLSVSRTYREFWIFLSAASANRGLANKAWAHLQARHRDKVASPRHDPYSHRQRI
jgi:hypothetical protein